MLSRPEFDAACKAYIAKHPGAWTWNEHPTWPGFGYMSRSAIQIKRESEKMEEDVFDEATASTDIEPLTCEQYIVYSASFQVPTFYFTMHNSQGAPLSLDDMLCTTLFRPFGIEKAGLTSSFPLVSQGEHPTLGTACWYVHPCETAKAVRELQEERGDGANVVEIWLLIVGNVVNA